MSSKAIKRHTPELAALTDEQLRERIADWQSKIAVANYILRKRRRPKREMPSPPTQ